MNQSTLSSFIDRLQALRLEIKKEGIDGYLVPMADEYQNEYLPSCARRITFLTGFTGSYAFILILPDRAVFFTDSRYTLQAAQQIPTDHYLSFDIAKTTPSEWIGENLHAHMRLGFDPKLHTEKQIERLEMAALAKNISLAPIQDNLIDRIWTDRPPITAEPIVPHDTTYAGKKANEKRREIAEILKKKNNNAFILTDPSSIAWLLNIRGQDVPMVPLPLSKAIIRADATVEWFVNPKKVSKNLDHHLGADITRYDETDFPAALIRLGQSHSRVLIDPNQTPYEMVIALQKADVTIERGDDPCALPRACKNLTEIDGMKSAHRRDGAALVKLMAWFDKNAGEGKLTELAIEEKLTEYRAQGSLYRGPSFDTIAGYGPNGAIVHYRATPETNSAIKSGSFLLLDSGAHYLDGTTDVTRTLPVGEPTKEMKDRYTRVLKGHIALAAIRFPEGTAGADLDVLARQYLWEEGLDYGHGTGHGVGSYLCVHEGPQAISRRSTVALRAGMVLSNEPGFYKARHFGIRLENLQFVTELLNISEPGHKMLGFEPLTLAPFDKRAIDIDLLTKFERAWLNAYHARVNKALRPQLDDVSADWLQKMTEEL